jgi:hypothetical protein
MLDKGKKLPKLACCALCCVTTKGAVDAAPPLGNSSPGGGALGRAAGAFAAKTSRNPASQLDRGRLDLRPPQTGGERAYPLDDSTPVFPSGKRASSVASDHVGDELPNLGGNTGGGRAVGRAEELTRRVQHEGVPIVRLWESHSALLHVGLSPRGKPGLWLIQKVP